MSRDRCLQVGLPLLLMLAGATGSGCSSSRPGAGQGPPTGGGGGAAAGGTGGSESPGGAGGSSGGGGGGAGGSPQVDSDVGGGTGGGAGTGPSGADAAPAASDGGPAPVVPGNYGKVGELVLVPLQYTENPVPPIIAPECPGDLLEGFTEYRDSFVVQRPYDLPAADRFKYENGIYTFWIQSNDKSHKPGNGTAPRTEARYSDISTGEHLWSADVMFESPSKTCVMQIHNVVGAIAVYLRVVGDRMFNLLTGGTIATGQTGKWFNLKVAFNTQTRQVRTYVNNCLKETSTAPSGTMFWYFKNGVYTCEAGTCRSSYKNLHLYQKGSTDKFNVKSTYP